MPCEFEGPGIVAGLDATPPDRFVFASWPRQEHGGVRNRRGASVGDSAVAMYWEPQQLAAGVDHLGHLLWTRRGGR
jgi:hypothetical protein